MKAGEECMYKCKNCRIQNNIEIPRKKYASRSSGKPLSKEKKPAKTRSSRKRKTPSPAKEVVESSAGGGMGDFSMLFLEAAKEAERQEARKPRTAKRSSTRRSESKRAPKVSKRVSVPKTTQRRKGVPTNPTKRQAVSSAASSRATPVMAPSQKSLSQRYAARPVPVSATQMDRQPQVPSSVRPALSRQQLVYSKITCPKLAFVHRWKNRLSKQLVNLMNMVDGTQSPAAIPKRPNNKELLYKKLDMKNLIQLVKRARQQKASSNAANELKTPPISDQQIVSLAKGINLVRRSQANQRAQNNQTAISKKQKKQKVFSDIVEFYKKLTNFLKSIAAPLTRYPTIGGQDVNLYNLYRQVIARGGYDRIAKSNQCWVEILQRLGKYSGSVHNACCLLRGFYQEYLYAYEQHVHFAKSLREVREKPFPTAGGKSAAQKSFQQGRYVTMTSF
eukprot:CAMPEP_0114519196 /NCGR_PEP_ID=MMETSP0109-20121206/18867_1 /TAXON_ID=29199 /ORGANISM="Chlorarachnion reptans, Strain CCCM449" /LENGTH=446 /DNA_ID=CAMNT_0001699905 /DNA_START=509 /DNA_END=1849 /DNA_ORIENTATION=-